jgi:hypothetical protein
MQVNLVFNVFDREFVLALGVAFVTNKTQHQSNYIPGHGTRFATSASSPITNRRMHEYRMHGDILPTEGCCGRAGSLSRLLENGCASCDTVSHAVPYSSSDFPLR